MFCSPKCQGKVVLIKLVSKFTSVNSVYFPCYILHISCKCCLLVLYFVSCIVYCWAVLKNYHQVHCVAVKQSWILNLYKYVCLTKGTKYIPTKKPVFNILSHPLPPFYQATVLDKMKLQEALIVQKSSVAATEVQWWQKKEQSKSHGMR